jgi:hypothetical protein
VARSLGKGCPDGQTSVARAGFCAALLEASVLRWLYKSQLIYALPTSMPRAVGLTTLVSYVADGSGPDDTPEGTSPL